MQHSEPSAEFILMPEEGHGKSPEGTLVDNEPSCSTLLRALSMLADNQSGFCWWSKHQCYLVEANNKI